MRAFYLTEFSFTYAMEEFQLQQVHQLYKISNFLVKLIYYPKVVTQCTVVKVL